MKIITNSDKELVRDIQEKIISNNGYCPCSLQRTEDTKCMCKEFRDQIDKGETGMCHCGLYIAET